MEECFAYLCPVLGKCRHCHEAGGRSRRTYVLDLFDGIVSVCGDPDGVGSHVDDDHDRFSDIPLEQIVDFLIRSSELGSGVIPPDHAFSGWPACRSDS